MKRCIVINADDFGFSPGTNKGVVEAHTKGCLTSTSIMATGPSFDEAVALSQKHSTLGIGVHLSLTLGRCVSNPHNIPLLSDSEGYLYANSLMLLIKTLLFPTQIKHQITQEFTAQIEKVKKAGIDIDHLDSQYHVHMMPLIFGIVCDLSQKYNIPIVRKSTEKLWTVTSLVNMFKWFVLTFYAWCSSLLGYKACVHPIFYGILHTQAITADNIIKILKQDDGGIVEILSHPGYFNIRGVSFDYDRQGIRFFLEDANRVHELRELTSMKLKKFIQEENITLYTFSQAYKQY